MSPSVSVSGVVSLFGRFAGFKTAWQQLRLNSTHQQRQEMTHKYSIYPLLLIPTLLGLANAAEWQAVAPINTARGHFAAGVIDNKIYIFGGQDSYGNNLQSTEMLDLAHPSVWTFMIDNTNERVDFTAEHSGADLNGKFYAFGAYYGEKPKSGVNFVGEFDPVGDDGWIPDIPADQSL